VRLRLKQQAHNAQADISSVRLRPISLICPNFGQYAFWRYKFA